MELTGIEPNSSLIIESEDYLCYAPNGTSNKAGFVIAQRTGGNWFSNSSGNNITKHVVVAYELNFNES